MFEGDGQVREYVAGYQDWIAQGGKLVSFADQEKEKEAKLNAKIASTSPVEKPKVVATKRSYKEQRELDQLPKQIEIFETKIAELAAVIASVDFYKQTQNEIDSTLAKLAAQQKELEALEARWESLLE